MRCTPCHRPIRPGLEARKRIERWEDPSGVLKTYGLGMPDGKLESATGTLVEVLHLRCYWAQERRVQRGGDAVTGTGVGGHDAGDRNQELAEPADSGVR